MNQKTVMITGASGGLGAAIARRFAHEKSNLALVGRNGDILNTVSSGILSEHPDIAIENYTVDFRDHKDTLAFLENDIRVDVLVNCAGVFPLKNLEASTNDDYEECFDVNVRAPFLLVNKFCKGMKHRRWGRVVNVCSSSSYSGSAESGLYCSSKHALLGLSRSQYLELKPHNIRVFSVSPGSIQTAMGATDFRQNFSTFVRPEEVADYIVYMTNFDKEMISEEVRLNRVSVE